MIRLGLIRNPKSTRNKRGGGDVREQAARLLGFYFAEPASPAELAEVLADFARNEVGIVVIDGGDGTVREVLSALPAAYGDDLPAVSILASGKTNLIAADVGTSGYGQKGFATLVEHARTGVLGTHIRRRPVLEARWDDGSHPPVRGMFLGAAAFTKGTDLAQDVHARGLNHGPAVAMTIAGTLWRTLFGNDPDKLLDGEPMTIVADGDNARAEGDRFLFLATTLHRLILGIWPFWGEGDKPIRYLDVASYPERLPAAVLPLMRGKPTSWMLADGYRSGVAGEIRMELTRPFIMDGEVFAPGPGGAVRLSAPAMIDFVVP